MLKMMRKLVELQRAMLCVEPRSDAIALLPLCFRARCELQLDCGAVIDYDIKLKVKS